MIRQGFRCLSTQDPCRIMKTRPAMITAGSMCRGFASQTWMPDQATTRPVGWSSSGSAGSSWSRRMSGARGCVTDPKSLTRRSAPVASWPSSWPQTC